MIRALLALAVVLCVIPATASAATRDVCPAGCTYATIQGAIDAAAAGDTVAVAPGRYLEQVTLAKAVTLVGTPGSPALADDGPAPDPTTTAIIAPPSGTALEVDVPWFTVDGFAIEAAAGPQPAVAVTRWGYLTHLHITGATLGLQFAASTADTGQVLSVSSSQIEAPGGSSVGVRVDAGRFWMGSGSTIRGAGVGIDNDGGSASSSRSSFIGNDVGMRCAGACRAQDVTFDVPANGTAIALFGTSDRSEVAGLDIVGHGSGRGISLDGVQSRLGIQTSRFHALAQAIYAAPGFTSSTNFITTNRFAPAPGGTAIVNDSSSALLTDKSWFGCMTPGACTAIGGAGAAKVNRDDMQIDAQPSSGLLTTGMPTKVIVAMSGSFDQPEWRLAMTGSPLRLDVQVSTSLGELAPAEYHDTSHFFETTLTVGQPVSGATIDVSMDGLTVPSRIKYDARLAAVGALGATRIVGPSFAGRTVRCVAPGWSAAPDSLTFVWRGARGKIVGNGPTHSLSLLDGVAITCLARARLNGHWPADVSSRPLRLRVPRSVLKLGGAGSAGHWLTCGRRAASPCTFSRHDGIRIKVRTTPSASVRASLRIYALDRRGAPLWVTGNFRLPWAGVVAIPRKLTESGRYRVVVTTPKSAVSLPMRSAPLYVTVR